MININRAKQVYSYLYSEDKTYMFMCIAEIHNIQKHNYPITYDEFIFKNNKVIPVITNKIFDKFTEDRDEFSITIEDTLKFTIKNFSSMSYDKLQSYCLQFFHNNKLSYEKCILDEINKDAILDSIYESISIDKFFHKFIVSPLNK